MEAQKIAVSTDWLKELNDEELRAVRRLIDTEEAARQARYDKEAWEQIERIAASRGFAVEKKKPRGRPRKKSTKQ